MQNLGLWGNVSHLLEKQNKSGIWKVSLKNLEIWKSGKLESQSKKSGNLEIWKVSQVGKLV